MKKILLMSPKDSSFYNFRSEMILRLKELGYDVILVCPYGSKIDYFISRECRFIDVKIDRRGTNVLADLKLICDYVKIIRKEHPDVVLTYTTKCSVYGGIACRITKVPYIVNNAGLIETENKKSILAWILKILYKVGFKKASCMMYQNPYERDFVNKIHNNKLHYRDIPGSGVNTTLFSYQPYPSNDEIITFNYVARVLKIKGIEEYLACAKQIKAEFPNTRFIIYGGFDDDEYIKIINEYVEDGIVEYAGELLDMKPAISSAHAVIHPSYYEGMTNVVLEHSAMGRVCIGSNIPGVANAIEHGTTGYVFEVKNVDELCHVVRDFILLPYQEKVALGVAASKKMKKEFDREIVTNTYIEEISKIVAP